MTRPGSSPAIPARAVRPPAAGRALVERLASPEPLVSVELRPPRKDLARDEGMDVWIDLHHSLRRVARAGRYAFLTDDAVGDREEENLQHLVANAEGPAGLARAIPFLTCKHTLEYCLTYAERARAAGVAALTVLGGDREAGAPRCVDHAYQLRARIRERLPDLPLGGWANPHRDPDEQAGWLVPRHARADFFLTQIVTHHSAGRVEALVAALEEREVEVPGIWGVFFFRSARAETLERLGRYFPVPAEELTREFESGASAEEICARTVRAIRSAGARHVYVSNLGFRNVEGRLRRILARL